MTRVEGIGKEVKSVYIYTHESALTKAARVDMMRCLLRAQYGALYSRG